MNTTLYNSIHHCVVHVIKRGIVVSATTERSRPSHCDKFKNPLVVGGLAALIAGGAGGLPNPAFAQQSPKGSDTTIVDTSKNGRAPTFPASTHNQYFQAAPNDFGITAIFVNYPNQPGVEPDLAIMDAVGGSKPTGYIGYNGDGIWAITDYIPNLQGKPFTVKLVDGKAVIQAREKYPPGLSHPSSAYADLLASQDKQSGSTAVASNTQGKPAGPNQRRAVGRGADILNDPETQAVLRGIGPGTATAQIQPLNGTGAKVTGGILTFKDAKGDIQTFKVERLSQGTPNPAAPAMGAFLFTAPDKKSGMLFTVMATENGAVSGMPLNEQALGMLSQQQRSKSPDR